MTVIFCYCMLQTLFERGVVTYLDVRMRILVDTHPIDF